MTTYPPPGQNPKCICPTMMAAMFCMTGHMLECHYPMACDEAQCSHWAMETAEDADSFDMPEIPDLDDLPDMPDMPDMDQI